MIMPAQKPGKSEQSVGTPRVFLDAVEKKFGTIDLDVAASHENAVAPTYYTEAEDGLAQPWTGNLNWCNPPFAKIGPWVEKANAEAEHGAHSCLLLPAGVGANWWRDHVHGKALVYLLNGRLTFVGHDKPYPKDLVLLYYSKWIEPNYVVWDWRKNEVYEL